LAAIRQLHTEILQTLNDRSTWTSRNTLFYQMRHDGLRRRAKPYPNAADLHFPLIDMGIEKLKPFYFSSVFGAQKLCQFVAMRQQQSAVSEAASDAMDWILREKTSLDVALLVAIDHMLQYGHGIIKTVWDRDENGLKFIPIDPQYLIVPKSANDIESADWTCEIRHMSVAEYRRNPQFSQEPEVLAALESNTERDGQSQYDQEKSEREGLTYTAKRGMAIVWEVRKKVRANDGNLATHVFTYLPGRPDLEVRAPFRLRTHFQGKPICSYADFRMEIKDVGFYSCRGVAERLAAHEAWACKTWNAKADIIDFTTKPMFNTESGTPNIKNITFQPGEVLTNGLKPIQFSPPPIDLDNEIQNTRSIAEQSIMMPDFGVGEGADGGNKTATEVDYIRTLSNTGVDLKGRVFRLAFRSLLRTAWALQLENNREEITYFIADSCKILPAQALHDEYHITPDGGTDSWNKGAVVQRAVQRMKMLMGNPNVDQERLTEDFLMADDARKAVRLFVPTKQRNSTESEDEAVEIMLMMSGYPAAVKPDEDHALRIKLIYQKLKALQMTGEPVNPMARQLLQMHIAQHMQILKQMNPDAAKEIEQAILAEESAPPAPPVAPPALPQAQPDPAAMDAMSQGAPMEEGPL
jgi:hypothetical protein